MKKKINSKQKGSRGEREWANFCREQGYSVRRTQQYAGGTEESADCVGLPYIHQEVKRYKSITDADKLNFLMQATNDCKLSGKGNIPIVAYKEDYGKWYVVIDVLDLATIYSESWDVQNSSIDYLVPVTLLAEDWFKLYREWEAGKAIEERGD